MKTNNYQSVENYFNKKDYLENSDDRILVRKLIVEEVFKESKNKKILDLGCGDGSVTLNLARNNKLTLVDISESMIFRAKANTNTEYSSNVDYFNQPIAELNFTNKYDIIISLGILAHVPDPDELISAISGYSSSNARVLIETTPKPFPIKKYLFIYYLLRGIIYKEKLTYSKNRMGEKELIKKMENLGFIHTKTYKYSFPLPGMRYWPKKIKFKYTLFTLKNSLMSKFGSEYILLFKK